MRRLAQALEGRSRRCARRDYSDPANRGPRCRGKRLYVGTVDARLVCLERRNGGAARDSAATVRWNSRRTATSTAVARRIRRHFAACRLSRPGDRRFIRRGQQSRADGLRRSARVRCGDRRTAVDVSSVAAEGRRRRRKCLVANRCRRGAASSSCRPAAQARTISADCEPATTSTPTRSLR